MLKMHVDENTFLPYQRIWLKQKVFSCKNPSYATDHIGKLIVCVTLSLPTFLRENNSIYITTYNSIDLIVKPQI